ncbi:hypothetical protein [Aureibaculum luteum]|uniref:hypothetical protein n=1 Tax=Aureibaculum luteum TaxID=1548456 RepID=UPI000E4D1BD8|nr:hypothetical protein [Aureibaculum luteum]
MKKLLIIALFIFIGKNMNAQEVVIPDHIKLETEEDFKQNESLVLASIEWIQNTPLDQEKAKRKQINAFLMQWMSGSPTVSIKLVQGLVPLECAECLMSFMSGWTKYSLVNNYSKDDEKCTLKGVESTIAFYEKNKSELGKNADIEKLIKRKNKGKLEKFVKSKI